MKKHWKTFALIYGAGVILYSVLRWFNLKQWGQEGNWWAFKNAILWPVAIPRLLMGWSTPDSDIFA